MQVKTYNDAIRYMSVPMRLNMIEDNEKRHKEYVRFADTVDMMFSWLKADSFRLWQFTIQLGSADVYTLDEDKIEQLHDITEEHVLYRYANVLLSMLGDELDMMEYLEFYLLQAMFVFYFHDSSGVKEDVIR